MVATVYGVAVSCRGVVVKHRETFVETGSSPVERDCHTLHISPSWYYKLATGYHQNSVYSGFTKHTSQFDHWPAATV